MCARGHGRTGVWGRCDVGVGREERHGRLSHVFCTSEVFGSAVAFLFFAFSNYSLYFFVTRFRGGKCVTRFLSRLKSLFMDLIVIEL